MPRFSNRFGSLSTPIWPDIGMNEIHRYIFINI